MSIGKEILKSDILTLLGELKIEENQSESINKFADILSDKIADAIKRGIDTATITQAQVAGTYPVTGTFTITAAK